MSDTVQISPVNLQEYSAMDWEGKRRVWLEISDITEEQFETHMAAQKAREENEALKARLDALEAKAAED